LQLLIIRHGQSVADIEGHHEGSADFPLTELGRRQAQAAAEWIARYYPPDAIVASPLCRAAETAHCIAGSIALPVILDDALREKANGVYAGLTFEYASQRYPRPEGGWKDHESPPGGESRIAFHARVQGYWSRLLATESPPPRLAIVTHGGVIQMLLLCFLGLPLDSPVRMGTLDSGIHLWQIDQAERRFLLANVQTHLESAGLRTPD